MQITFVAPFGLRQKTTVWARILPLARRLHGLGHGVTILIPPWDSPADAGQSWVDHGVRVVNVRLGGGLPFVLWRLWRHMQRERPAIVHIVKPRAHAGLIQWLLWPRHRWRKFIPPFPAHLPAKCSEPSSRLGSARGQRRAANAPHIILDIDDWEQAWAAINHYPWPAARFLAWQEEWGIRHADAITAASTWLMARAAIYAPSTPRLYLPNGVAAPERSAFGKPDRSSADARTKTILYYTRFVEIEPAWLAAFWRALQQQVGAVTLEVAGNALVAGREAAFKEAVDLATQPDNRVNWRGFVDPEMQDQLYAAADCAIFPAQPVPLQQAKCSVRLATTLLHGVPVVASAVGQQAEYGGDGAAHLVAADAAPYEFATAVAQLLAQPAQRAAMIERAHGRLLTQFNWDDLGDQLAAFYTELLTAGPS
ncbi:MAG: glycosyltransferase [Caldilineaceae bacterium]